MPTTKQRAGGDFCDQLRLSGAEARMPAHYLWYNILRTLGWEIFDDVDEPERLAPAFYVAPSRGERLPVMCEVYSYMPGDRTDRLEKEAVEQVEDLYPDGALLLFNAMPYLEVAGRPYSFAGRLYLGGKWSDVALSEHVHSIDDVIEQAASGFTFGKDCPRWADENARLAVAATLMSYEVEDPAHAKIMAMKSGDWHIIMPG